MILAAALLFSTFTTPFLSGLFTLSVFIIGHITVDLRVIADNFKETAAKAVIDWLYYLLPNLERLNFKAAAVHRLPIAFQDYLAALTYGVLYTLIILCGSVLIFNRRDMR